MCFLGPSHARGRIIDSRCSSVDSWMIRTVTTASPNGVALKGRIQNEQLLEMNLNKKLPQGRFV